MENEFFFSAWSASKGNPEKSHKKAQFINGGKIPKKGVPERVKNEHLTPFIKLCTFYSAFRLESLLRFVCTNNDQYSAFNLQLKFGFLFSQFDDETATEVANKQDNIKSRKESK